MCVVMSCLHSIDQSLWNQLQLKLSIHPHMTNHYALQAPSCHRPRSSTTPTTPARYWLLQMLLEWALTCKCHQTNCSQKITKRP